MRPSCVNRCSPLPGFTSAKHPALGSPSAVGGHRRNSNGTSLCMIDVGSRTNCIIASEIEPTRLPARCTVDRIPVRAIRGSGTHDARGIGARRPLPTFEIGADDLFQHAARWAGVAAGAGAHRPTSPSSCRSDRTTGLRPCDRAGGVIRGSRRRSRVMACLTAAPDPQSSPNTSRAWRQCMQRTSPICPAIVPPINADGIETSSGRWGERQWGGGLGMRTAG